MSAIPTAYIYKGDTRLRVNESDVDQFTADGWSTSTPEAPKAEQPEEVEAPEAPKARKRK